MAVTTAGRPSTARCTRRPGWSTTASTRSAPPGPGPGPLDRLDPGGGHLLGRDLGRGVGGGVGRHHQQLGPGPHRRPAPVGVEHLVGDHGPERSGRGAQQPGAVAGHGVVGHPRRGWPGGRTSPGRARTRRRAPGGPSRSGPPPARRGPTPPPGCGSGRREVSSVTPATTVAPSRRARSASRACGAVGQQGAEGDHVLGPDHELDGGSWRSVRARLRAAVAASWAARTVAGSTWHARTRVGPALDGGHRHPAHRPARRRGRVGHHRQGHQASDHRAAPTASAGPPPPPRRRPAPAAAASPRATPARQTTAERSSGSPQAGHAQEGAVGLAQEDPADRQAAEGPGPGPPRPG